MQLVEGDQETGAGSRGGGEGIRVSYIDSSVIESGVQGYDRASDTEKSIQEVYDTISARPETFHIITEAPIVRQTVKPTEDNLGTILLLAKEAASANGVEEENTDGSRSSGGLESYFGQLLQVTRHINVDNNSSRLINNQEDSHINVSDNPTQLKDEVLNRSPPPRSTYNGTVKVSRENESQTIGENSHKKQVETHATGKEALIGDSVDFKVKLEDLGSSAPGHVQGSSTESTVIRYTWQNIPNRRIDVPPPSTEESPPTTPSKIDDVSLGSSHTQVPNKTTGVSFGSDFFQIPSDKPDTSHGSSSSSNRGKMSHGSGEILISEKGESENPSLAPQPILGSLQQDDKVAFIYFLWRMIALSGSEHRIEWIWVELDQSSETI